jgi:ATP-dependent Lon protease
MAPQQHDPRPSRDPASEARARVFAQIEERLRDARMTPAAEAHARRELDQLGEVAPGSPGAARIRAHLEWMLELPWSRRVEPPTVTPHERFAHVAQALDRGHVGLREVKERVAEYLAVRHLGGAARGTVLCFQGPPGTGKSTFGRAIARALGRPLVPIPVGGMTNEDELTGVSHRRDDGAPGAILAALHRARASNPVVLLEEIDKLHFGYEGNSAGALLHLLDREHQSEFVDQYLGVPFDLSDCLFIATVNDLSDCPESLQDRLEVVEFSGYTEVEKLTIARDHLLLRARRFAGITKSQLRLTPAALRLILTSYTEEAGVREMQRRLSALARKAAVKVVRSGSGLHVRKRDVAKLLGPPTVEEEIRQRRPAVGVTTGLAWTSAGGALLPIELLAMAGQGRMILTGQIGDVMRESVQTAISYVRTRFESLGLDGELLDSLDLHMHFPCAATPKDGPSAGIAIAAAITSCLTGLPARHDVAMTGELSLRGTVLPVGGIREKSLAAIRAGIGEIIVPEANAQEVLQLPTEIRSRLTFQLVSHAQEAVSLALQLPDQTTPGAGPAANLRAARPRVAREAKPAE